MYFRQGENNILKDHSASEHCNEGCGQQSSLLPARQAWPRAHTWANLVLLGSQGLPQACCTAAGPWAVQHFSYTGTFWTNRGGWGGCSWAVFCCNFSLSRTQALHAFKIPLQQVLFLLPCAEIVTLIPYLNSSNCWRGAAHDDSTAWRVHHTFH